MSSTEDWIAKLEIIEVAHRYSDTLQHADWEGFESLFTEDAVFEALGPGLDVRVQGARAIRDKVIALTADAALFMQVPLSVVVDLEGDDRARATTVVHETIHRGREHALMIYGICYNTLAKVDSTWRFSRRHFITTYVGKVAMGGQIAFDRGALHAYAQAVYSQ